MTDSFFIVFDTCTHAAYYSDVHQVLSLPEGALSSVTSTSGSCSKTMPQRKSITSCGSRRS